MSDLTKLSDADLMAALNPPAPAGVTGMSDADLMKALGQPAAAQPSVVADVAKSAGSGLVRGATGIAGIVGDAAGWLGSGADAAANVVAPWAARGANYLLGTNLETSPAAPRPNPVANAIGSASLNRGIDNATGAPVTSYEPQTTAGRYAKTAGEFVPGALLGPGGAVRNAMLYGVAPGLASEAAGQAAQGTALEPVARVAGALTAVAAPSAIGRAITPLPISPQRQAVVEALRNEGIPLTAGQSSGSRPLQYAESIFGDAPLAGGQARATMEAQGEAFTSAAMRRAGSDGLATPENMSDTYRRIGQSFTDLAGRNTLVADAQLGTDINTALQQYGRKLPSEQRAIVGNEATEIIARLQANGGQLAGREYQTIRSDLSRRASNATDPEFGAALRGLRDALDGNMARSISPDDAAAWAQARREYGNWKTLAKAVGGAGENAANGIITPQALRQATAGGRGKEAYVRGEGDFAGLARDGVSMMTPLPNSGTAQRQMIGTGMGGGVGAALATSNIPLAAAIAAGPGVLGRTLYSGPVQGYLSNQLMAGRGPSPQEIVAQALVSSRSSTLPSR